MQPEPSRAERHRPDAVSEVRLRSLSCFLLTTVRKDAKLYNSRDRRAKHVKRLMATEGELIVVPRPGDFSRICVIPKGHVWVQGDNEEDDEDDSRDYGPVPMALIDGKALAVVWPPERARWL